MKFLILIFLLIASQASAATYWASPQGSNTSTCAVIAGDTPPTFRASFARAVACATKPGDRVMVEPGNYDRDVAITNPASGITIQGSEADPAKWPVLRPTGSNVRGVNFNAVTRSGIGFRYLRWDFTNAATVQNCINASSDSVVSYTLEDFECLGPLKGKALRSASGIKTSPKTGPVIIRRGTIRRWISTEGQPGAHCFYWSSSNGLIEGVKCSEIDGYGIQFYGPQPITGNIFRGNDIRDAQNKGGVMVSGNATGNEISGNLICRAKNPLTVNNANNSVKDNKVLADCPAVPIPDPKPDPVPVPKPKVGIDVTLPDGVEMELKVNGVKR